MCNGHSHEHGHDHGHCHEEGLHWWQPVVAGAMLAAGLVAEHCLGVEAQWWVRLMWYVAAFLPVGWCVVHEAIESAEHGEVFSEFMLMSVAAIGAFALGEYPEAVAVMLLYQIGETLQDMAVDRARDNIKSLMALRPDKAMVVSGDAVVEQRPEDVAVGATIEVRPGDRVPLDGVLLGHAADFDTSALTGESVPRSVEQGGEVLAGMIAVDTAARLRVVRPAGESAVSRILTMVEDANSRKATAELLMHRFARIYTPVVIALAALVTLLPLAWSWLSPSWSYDFSVWFERSLVFLVISCPCALVISIPLTYFAGIGAASRKGILFKGGNYIDALNSVDTVCFDKTGTLTTGRFGVVAMEGLSPDDLRMVARMELSSTHPIARAVVEYANIEEKNEVEPLPVKTISGYGLEYGGWLVGTRRLMEKGGVRCPDHLRTVAETLVAVAKDGEFKGYLLLADTPKEDAGKAIKSLKVESEILSGDHQALVDKLASRLGISRGHGDLLPQGKVEHIEALQRQGHKVAFVGDGINDAPVLALADVGIAMGAMGADMAVETADIIIQTDQPSKVAEAMAICRRTRRIVRQNIVFSIGFKVAVMLLGVVGLANMWIAVFADSGVALLAVLNSLRVMRK